MWTDLPIFIYICYNVAMFVTVPAVRRNGITTIATMKLSGLIGNLIWIMLLNCQVASPCNGARDKAYSVWHHIQGGPN